MTTSRREVLSVTGLVAFAALLRAWVAARAGVIGSDGYWFLRQADRWPTLPWKEALTAGGGQHPGYAMFVATLRPWIGGNLETAAYAVSVIFGALAVIPVYGLARRMAGTVAAVIAGVLAATLPLFVELSADTMSDAPMLMLALFAAWFGWESLLSKRVTDAAAAGLAGGMAYLVRPEGIVILAPIGLAWLYGALRARIPLKSFCLGAAALTAGFLIVAAPLLWHVRQESGRWGLTRKWDPMLALQETPPKVAPSPTAASPEGGSIRTRFVARFGDPAGDPLFVANQALKGSHYAIVPFAMLGVWLIRRRDRDLSASGAPITLSALLLLAMAFYFGVGWTLSELKGYCGTRHVLILPLLALPWAGVGIQFVGTWIGTRGRAGGGPAGISRVTAWTGAVLLAVTGVHLAKIARPPRGDQAAFRMAGEWIRERQPSPRPYVCSRYDKIAYYAAGEHVVATAWTFAAISEQARAGRIDFLVALRSDVEKAGGDLFAVPAAPGFESVREFRLVSPGRRGEPDVADELRVFEVTLR